MTGTLTDAQLHATLVGTPDGRVICDSCNTLITTVRRLRNGQEDTPTAHVYVTGDAHGWQLRWTHCVACGPIGEGQATEPGEAHATATLVAHPRRDLVLINECTITACTPPDSDEEERES